MDGGHKLSVGIESFFVYSRGRFFGVGFFYAVAFCKGNEGGLGGIAYLGPVGSYACVVTEHKAFEKRVVSVFIEGVEIYVLSVCKGADNGHSVLCESARLIGADVAYGSEGLNGGHILDYGVYLRHSLHTEGENDGNDGGYALGNSGNRKGDCRDQKFKHLASLYKTYNENYCADDDDGDAQHLAQTVHTLLQGRGFVFFLADHIGDLAYFGVHARAHDLAHAATVGYDGGHIRKIEPVAYTGLFSGNEVFVLLDGNGFACESLFIDHKSCCFKELKIGRHLLARFKYDDIAHDKLFGGYFLYLAVTHDGGFEYGHFFQCVKSLLRLALLNNAYNCVCDNYDEHDDRFAVILQYDGDDYCRRKNRISEVEYLLKEHLQYRFRLFFLQTVSSVFGKPFFGFFPAQSFVALHGLTPLHDFLQTAHFMRSV